ncbi:MAG: hypothetical protein UT66_C0004G0026 [candidate division CPR2 bacterium GW2011_GWC1_39_9]|uniref:Methyltransferase type 11 domain-containing protein n=1 Tax=candidate division CPR2 bacterium GW2011_GWC2_39_10 TaxID=1618345 RepID=A0A0G0M3J5_UNCC2|nr:MAG: hypothetical protein UT18_C0006G0023 [candidate division CPR2 bacterium GW2011_GWC2_39_10]KKR36031.1 MAG: hypothetical protein UT66_C0004G0026 [candidate division CPR2 bacterium GW2011_GWC1_39_9]
MNEKKAKEIYASTIKTYENISESFSDTRNRAWPEFEIIKKYLKSGQKVLDIGCGNGRFLNYQEADINYYGVDPSSKLLEIAKKKHQKAIFKKGDFLNLPFGDNFFDIVVSIAAYHHVPSVNLRIKALNDVKRVLKKDGLFILTVWDLYQPKYEKFIVKNQEQAQKKGLEVGDSFIPWQKKEDRYYHAFTKDELDAELASVFSIIRGSQEKFNYLYILK